MEPLPKRTNMLLRWVRLVAFIVVASSSWDAMAEPEKNSGSDVSAKAAGPSEKPEAARPAVPSTPKPTPAPAATAPKRSKVTCTVYRANADKQAAHSTFSLKIKAGDWGHIPPPLRKLPARARLCGADGMGQAVIVSSLFGQDLEAFYTPLFTKAGFKPLSCKVTDGRTQCTCKRGRDIGIVLTDPSSEALVLSLIRR
jgi:hypothetical protein